MLSVQDVTAVLTSSANFANFPLSLSLSLAVSQNLVSCLSRQFFKHHRYIRTFLLLLHFCALLMCVNFTVLGESNIVQHF